MIPLRSITLPGWRKLGFLSSVSAPAWLRAGKLPALSAKSRPNISGGWISWFIAAEDNNIGLIPSLFWRLASVPEVVGESRDQLGNPNSRANQFIRQYTREMVSRYNDSPAIWGWEFGNEANLGVDLGRRQCKERKAETDSFLASYQAEEINLAQGQLRTVFASFAQTIRSIDRRASWSLARVCPVPPPGTWPMDRPAAITPSSRSSSLLTLTPDPMDVDLGPCIRKG